MSFATSSPGRPMRFARCCAKRAATRPDAARAEQQPVFLILESTMEQGTLAESRARRRRVSRQVRRTPVRRNIDDVTFDDEEREIVIGGDDKPQVSA